MMWMGWTGDNDPGGGCLLELASSTPLNVFNVPTLDNGEPESARILGELDEGDLLVFLDKIHHASFKNSPYDEIVRWCKVFSKFGPGWVRMHRVRPVNWRMYQD